jgi:RNA polymerase sigma factor (sigma-70 family)
MNEVMAKVLASDEEVIQRILAGEQALFEVLIRRYNSLLYKIARGYGFGHDDAQDLMQESHVSAYTSLSGFRADASYKTWLTRIHLNKCYHKMNYGHLKYEDADTAMVEAIVRPTEKQDTAKMVMNKELGKVLEQSLQQLPQIYRSVFLLREMEGFSVNETAELLNITPVNVKVRLSRAKALLQTQLEQHYSLADIYEFNLKYCDGMVERVMRAIANA